MSFNISLLKKYQPTNVNNIVGNKKQINELELWLSSINKHKNKSIIISGNNGIGKTIITRLLLKKYNYDYNIIYPEDIKKLRLNDEKKNNDILDYFEETNNLSNFIKINKKKALVFDDSEFITLTTDKKFILDLIKKNKNNIPIIFISNNNHSKLLNDIKKVCNEIKLYPPSSYELNKLLVDICNNENIKIIDKEGVNKLIQLSQYDIRRMINLLQDFIFNYKTITNENINKFCNKTIKKNTNYGLYESTLSLLNDKLSFENIYRIYENEKVLLPLMLYENIYKKILNDNNNINNKLDDMVKIINSFSDGDIIETSIYTDQNWCLQDIHGFHTNIYPSKICNKYNKNILASSIKFSSDLNKTSLKNINKKNINNLIKLIGNKSINEILLLSKLTNYCYDNNNINQIIDILKEYNNDIDIKDVELCLKINKTIDFSTLTNKNKKNIMQYISNN